MKTLKTQNRKLTTEIAANREHSKSELAEMTAKLATVCGLDKGHDNGTSDEMFLLQDQKMQLEKTLRKLTDATERLKGQLDAANRRLNELEQENTTLKEQNVMLHQKMARVKGSIIISEQRSASCISPDIVSKRPESSKLRVRLDDSSNLSKDKGHSALSADYTKGVDNLPALDESFNYEELPKARAAELSRLVEENRELKEKLMQLKHSRELSEAPLGMTTFSAAKDSRADRRKMEDTEELGKGISEVGKRLVNLLAKTGCPTHTFTGQPWSFPLLKDVIYELDEKVQSMQGSLAGLESYRTTQPSRVPYHQQQNRPVLTDNMDNSGHFGHDTTMDMTKYDRAGSGDRSHSGDRKSHQSFDIKNKLLDEKEKRLTIQETLTKTREE